MRRTILTLATIAIMAGSVSTLFGQEPDKQSAKARENLQEAKEDAVDANKEVVVAKQDLKDAKKDSIADYLKFKTESELKIKENEKSIADLKAKQAKMNEKDKIAYQKKVNALEQKNIELKKKLFEYKHGKPDRWETFRREFNHDMDELQVAMKDFTINNKN